MSMNPQQTRVVDPVLTTLAQGYTQQEFVGGALFPRVPVQTAGGKIIEFGKESFRLYNTKRGRGSNTKRITFGYEGKPYALEEDSLEAQVEFKDMRDASQVPGIDLATRSVNGVLRIMGLGLEYAQASAALDINNYDADHKVDLIGSQWSDPAINPGTDIKNGKQAIADYIGVEPNTIVLSKAAFYAAQDNPFILERFKYTGSESVTTAMLAKLWDLEDVRVGKSIWFDDNDQLQNVWGNDAVMAYVEKNPSSKEIPSYGYTYEMENNPFVEQPYQDRPSKSWIYPVTTERDPVLAAATAAYLMKNVG